VLLTGLLSGLTYGLCSIFGKLLSRPLSPITILSYALGIGAALLLVAALPTLRTLAGLSFGFYALLFILAVVHTALAFGLYTAGLKRLDAGQAAIVATVDRWRRARSGSPCSGRRSPRQSFSGALLVLAGAALAQVRCSKRRPEEPRPPSSEAPSRPR
jgi:drug/metabolite transporter, DME family